MAEDVKDEIDEEAEERAWVRSAAKHFLAGYAASDDIYDDVS